MLEKSFYLLTWNLENLFHPETGGPRFDMTVNEGWTEDKYRRKVERLGNVLKQIINNFGQNQAPFIFGFTEVENPRVMGDLLSYLPPHYQIALDPQFKEEYFDSLIVYDNRFFELNNCRTLQTFARFCKGDAVQADFLLKESGQKLTVFNCHLKARPDNRYYTSMYREAVCDNLQSQVWRMHGGAELRDKLKKNKNPDFISPENLPYFPNAVLMGDFNDEPFSPSMVEYLRASYDWDGVKNQNDLNSVLLYNCAWEKLMESRPGTNYYEKGLISKWSMLDQIIISPGLIKKSSGLSYRRGSFKIIDNLTADDQGKPYRTSTYDENDQLVWQEGFSDHFPVVIQVNVVN